MHQLSLDTPSCRFIPAHLHRHCACAVKRRWSTAGESPARELGSLHPEAIGAAVGKTLACPLNPQWVHTVAKDCEAAEESLMNEDQGELAKRFAGGYTQSGPIHAPEPFFSAELPFDSREKRDHPADAVLQPVCEHSRAQVLAPVGQQPKKPSLYRDGYHCLTVKAMSETKDDPLQDEPERTSTCPCIKLSRKVSAKDELFRKPGGRNE